MTSKRTARPIGRGPGSFSRAWLQPNALCWFHLQTFGHDERKDRPHAGLGRRMLETATRFSLLAFGTPGFAPDEHLSGTQRNHWSRHEPNQAKRCEESSVSALPHKNTSVRPGQSALCNRLFRARTGRNQNRSNDFCSGFRGGTFVTQRSGNARRSFARLLSP